MTNDLTTIIEKFISVLRIVPCKIPKIRSYIISESIFVEYLINCWRQSERIDVYCVPLQRTSIIINTIHNMEIACSALSTAIHDMQVSVSVNIETKSILNVSETLNDA